MIKRKKASDIYKVQNRLLHKAMIETGMPYVENKEVWLKLPAIQSQLRFAEYRVEVESKKDSNEIEGAIRSILQKKSLPWEHNRGESVHRYDLRTLIDDIWIISQSESGYTLGMRLRNDSKGSGRPDQVLRALGFDEPATSIHRIKLILGNNQCN